MLLHLLDDLSPPTDTSMDIRMAMLQGRLPIRAIVASHPEVALLLRQEDEEEAMAMSRFLGAEAKPRRATTLQRHKAANKHMPL
jgi:hypothetical protein